MSFYAILRYYQVGVAALGPRFPRAVLLVFGVASLLLAALYLLDQRDIKRLLAYSSVEHMGILTIGVSFGAPVALAGVLLHVLAHAAAKGNAFMGAGVLVRKFGSKRISRSAAAWTCCRGAGRCCCSPCSRCPRCRRSGSSAASSRSWPRRLRRLFNAAAAVLIVLASRWRSSACRPRRTGCCFRPADARAAARYSRGEPSAWMVLPVAAGIAVLLVLGVHPPAELTGLLTRAAALLGGMA